MSVRSRRRSLVLIAALLALGWLAWNVLLVESELETAAESETPSPPRIEPPGKGQ